VHVSWLSSSWCVQRVYVGALLAAALGAAGDGPRCPADPVPLSCLQAGVAAPPILFPACVTGLPQGRCHSCSHPQCACTRLCAPADSSRSSIRLCCRAVWCMRVVVMQALSFLATDVYRRLPCMLHGSALAHAKCKVLCIEILSQIVCATQQSLDAGAGRLGCDVLHRGALWWHHGGTDVPYHQCHDVVVQTGIKSNSSSVHHSRTSNRWLLHTRPLLTRATLTTSGSGRPRQQS
jgi:hypothetical protein